MNLTIERTTLLRALSHAQSVVDRRATVPILANVLLHAEHGRLTMRATDMDLEIIETVPCAISEPGTTTLPAGLIHSLVRSTAEGSQISISKTDNGRIRVKGGRSKSDIPCLGAEEFPAMEMRANPVRFEMDDKMLLAILKRVAFAASVETTRFYLNGIYVHVVRDLLVAVATDGVMLGRTEIPLPEGAEAMPGTIIPNKTVTQLVKILEDSNNVVLVEISDNLARFTVGPVTLTSKLIDNQYPDYTRAIPHANDRFMEIDREVMLSALGRAVLFCEGKNNTVILSYENGGITMTAANTDAGDFVEEMDAAYDGPSGRIGLNCVRVSTILGNIGGKSVRIKMGGPHDGPLISDAGEAATMYLLNPLRV